MEEKLVLLIILVFHQYSHGHKLRLGATRAYNGGSHLHYNRCPLKNFLCLN